MSRLLLTPILMAVWLALWGEASVGNIVGGVIVIAVVLVVFDQGPGLHAHRFSPGGMARMIARFLSDLVTSSWRVIVAVIAPTPERIRTGVVAVPLTCADPVVLKTVSDLLCLTPGTLTVEIDTDPVVLYVHVLGLDDADQIRHEVQALERRVLAAFPYVAREENPSEVDP